MDLKSNANENVEDKRYSSYKNINKNTLNFTQIYLRKHT